MTTRALGRGLETMAPARPRPGAPAPTHDSPPTTHPCPALEYVDETPKRPRRTNDEIAVEDGLEHVWVTLMSIDRPLPRRFGDNHGALPVWVEANKDWRQSGVIFDANQWDARAIRLMVMGVRNEVDQKELKRVLDEALHGRAEAKGADPLRHRFRNLVDVVGLTPGGLVDPAGLDAWWTPILADAVARCELVSREFEIFSRADHAEMVRKGLQRLEMDRQRGRR